MFTKIFWSKCFGAVFEWKKQEFQFYHFIHMMFGDQLGSSRNFVKIQQSGAEMWRCRTHGDELR